MIQKTLLAFFLLALPLSAKILISPIDAMKQAYGGTSTITKKNILLSNKNAAAIQKAAQVRLSTKIFRIFKATDSEKLLGYGVLVNRKVRSKNAVVLYLISRDSVLTSMEIIAFNEPVEYIPSKNWNSQFDNVPTNKMLHTSKEIHAVTGATLSARAITDGSRIAFAIYNELLKGKE